MKKLTGSLLVATLAMSAMLSGCGSSAAPAQAPAGEAPAAAEEAPAEAAEEAGAEGGEVLTIISVGTETDNYTKTMREFAKEFSENNEYGVTVEFELYENDQYKTKLPTLMASDAVSDIFFTWELGYLQPFVEAGKVVSLQQYMDEDPEWRDNFIGGILDYVTYDGEVYAVPQQTAYCTMYYNKGLFSELNLEVPKTWDEFIHVCDVLKEAGVAPMTMEATEAWVPAQFVHQISLGIGGPDVFNGVCQGTTSWNNSCYIEAAQIVQDMVNDEYFADGMLAMSYDEAVMKFENGEAGMYFMATWDASEFMKEDEAIEVGTFNLPAINPEYHDMCVGSADTSYAISKNCKNVDAAVAFLKFITSKDWQSRDLAANAKIPTVKLDTDAVELQPIAIDMVNNMKEVQIFPWFDRFFNNGEGDEFNNACLAVVGGDEVQSTFDNLQEIIDANADR